MKTFSTQCRPFYFIASLALTGASSTLATGLTFQKVPPLTVEQAPAYPENLARFHLGAQIEATPKSRPSANLQLGSGSIDQNTAEAALLCDDATVGYALPTGATTVLVSLPRIENVGSISFLNKGAKGKITIATANAKLPPNSPQWHNVSDQELASDLMQANVGPSEAKYVRLTFNVTEPGRIAGFGLYSNPQVSDFTAPRARNIPVQDKSDSFALISYNYTNIHDKARALYVSSGSDVSKANNMIDDQPATNFAFAAQDAAPATVIDLGKPCTLRRLSAIYSPRAGRMDFYVLQSLPATANGSDAPDKSNAPAPTPENAPASLQLDEAALADLKAVGSVNDDGSQGRASVDFPETAGRYVMVRWVPAAQAASPFSLAEVAAFGRGSQNTLLAANTTTSDPARDTADAEGQTSDGKTMMDGKTMLEPKDTPREGPERESPGEGPPPSLPQAPPFTFVPVLVPTSP